jgi:hypothetical protein
MIWQLPLAHGLNMLKGDVACVTLSCYVCVVRVMPGGGGSHTVAALLKGTDSSSSRSS